MSGPPPTYTPPPLINPPGVPRSSWIAIAVLAITSLVGFLALVGVLLYLNFRSVIPRSRNAPGERITSRDLGRGWAFYYLRPMELSIALPSPPKSYAYDNSYFKTNRAVSEYAAYRTTGRTLFTIHGYWERLRPIDMTSRVNRMAQRIQANVGELRLVRRGELMIGGIPGAFYRCEYDGPKFKKPNVFECSIVFRDKTVYYFECVYLKKDEAWGKRAFNYAMRSVRFDP